VRLIDEAGEQLGIVSVQEALTKAKEVEMDLIEVSPNTNPPVCKIMDYGKYQYRQNKIEQKHKRMQKQTEVKGIRLSFRTDDHDLETKINQAVKFLKDRNIVKVALIFKGREVAYAHLAKEKMDKFAEGIKEYGKIDEGPKKQGYNMIMIISPLK